LHQLVAFGTQFLRNPDTQLSRYKPRHRLATGQLFLSPPPFFLTLDVSTITVRPHKVNAQSIDSILLLFSQERRNCYAESEWIFDHFGELKIKCKIQAKLNGGSGLL
jgi:hypothetical protein